MRFFVSGKVKGANRAKLERILKSNGHELSREFNPEKDVLVLGQRPADYLRDISINHSSVLSEHEFMVRMNLPKPKAQTHKVKTVTKKPLKSRSQTQKSDKVFVAKELRVHNLQDEEYALLNGVTAEGSMEINLNGLEVVTKRYIVKQETVVHKERFDTSQQAKAHFIGLLDTLTGQSYFVKPTGATVRGKPFMIFGSRLFPQ